MRSGVAGNTGGPLSREKQNEMAIFRAEAEAQTDLIRRMVGACKCKCINPDYKTPELELGEAMCVDRCVQKYYSAQNKVPCCFL